MGGASYPKPDGERRNRAERQLDWTMLPFEGRAGDPPALPKWRDYAYAGKPLVEAPEKELKRLLTWKPSSNPEQYESLKAAIRTELARRQAAAKTGDENNFEAAPAGVAGDDGLPF